MSVMTLSGLHKTGQFVSADMFGANAVFEQTDEGQPTSTYVEAIDALGVQNIRFGGGQADLDPTKENAAGQAPVEGESAINIVTMQDGALRPELVTFLEWCKSRQDTDHPVTATLIIPTKHLSAEEYEGFAVEVEAFAATVMAQYGDVIAAFQIGNEYWEMGETSYGIKASLGAEAIDRGMSAAGYAGDNQPDVLIQMGTAGNEGSEFPVMPGVSDFAARNKAANEQIIAQLSDSAKNVIDGVTEHFYFNKDDYSIPDINAAVKNVDKDFQVWDAAFEQKLDLFITEWNVKTTATSQHGMVAASSLIKQFEYMTEMGVDGAHIWALDYHSRTALTLDTDNGARMDEAGRLTNSAQGAAFDLMEDALVGKELVAASFDNAMPDIEVSTYTSETEIVFYISSRALEQVSLTLDLGTKLPFGNPVEAVKIALDAETSNGQQWARGEAARSVEIDGEAYFYNEHDVDVIFSDMVFEDASAIDLTLNPFEVVELTVSLEIGTSEVPKQVDLLAVEVPSSVADKPAEDKHYFIGTDADELISLTPSLVYIDAGDGVDTVVVDASGADVTFKIDGFGKPVMHVPNDLPDVTLNNVERVAFEDGVLALDIEGNSGQAYRLYQASFDRTPDEEGLAFWIAQLDSGAVSLLDAAEHFLKSDEFADAYGKKDVLSDKDYVDLLYANVLDRTPDKEGYDFWREQQEKDVSREQMLVSFSESVENKANVAPVIDDGIWFG
ncbi:MAG: DUF4214 domain-containing protein [Sulfitobacter sp.]